MAPIAPRQPLKHRAWQYTTTKPPLEANLVLNHTATVPTPKSNQHLIQIIAAALNPVDYKPAERSLISSLFVKKPATPCNDISGRVIKPAVNSSLKAGQLVCGTSGNDNPLAGGALAEFAWAELGSVTALPAQGVDVIDAAGVGIAGLTAYQSLVPYVKRGDKVFINGGSGGCGVMSIQIAKVLGCYVTTSCSTTNIELCKSLGADEVIDYTKQNLIQSLVASGGFDHVMDNVAGDTSLYFRCHEYTNPTAIYVKAGLTVSMQHLLATMKMTLLPGFLGGGKRKLLNFLTKTNPDHLAQVVSWMEEGKVRMVVDEIFAFEDAPKAFSKLRTGRVRGKVIVDVASATYEQVKMDI
ncbi:hypothetical protein HYFRA_00009140 [Hymenoscyphus fraxineus]|uniref:Enoyl reductase (ER) domain-containing protein n=1 Tax=Hymenoscyphus fraxineus TaxID=746836 RepID=A0A9N9KTN3_9HELO|nr:hypothetical protein HYFRA_00009140 [Hymenoscyphus fraxineus]